MKLRVLSLLLLIALYAVSYSTAEELTPSSFSPQQLELEAFTLSVDYDWVFKELTQEDTDNGLLLQADRADGSQNLLVFKGGEGDFGSILEMTALNEYSGIAKREDSQTYNSLQFAFTTSEENRCAAAYISLEGTIYSFQLTSKPKEEHTAEKNPLETLQGILLSLMPKP